MSATDESECPHCGYSSSSERGVRIHRSKAHNEEPTEHIPKRLRKVAEDLGHAPTAREFRNHDSGLSKRLVYNHYGSWEDALEAAGLAEERRTYCAECEHNFSTYKAWAIHDDRVHGEDAPDVGLLEAIHNLADGDEPPRQSEMWHNGPYSSGTYSRVYGSWKNALREAGYDPTRTAHNRVPTEELLEELRRLKDELSHSPRIGDMREQGRYSTHAYMDRFGGWVAAQESAGVGTHYAAKGEGDGHNYYAGGWHTARQKALRRDQARCQDCRQTESSHYAEWGRGLDVHHIESYAKHDDAKEAHCLENLVTLCRDCHNDRESV